MGLPEILAMINREIAQLQKARAVLSGGVAPTAKRKAGRPRKIAVAVITTAAKPAKKKKRNLSPEGRRRIAEAVKKRWAAQNASGRSQEAGCRNQKGIGGCFGHREVGQEKEKSQPRGPEAHRRGRQEALGGPEGRGGELAAIALQRPGLAQPPPASAHLFSCLFRQPMRVEWREFATACSISVRSSPHPRRICRFRDHGSPSNSSSPHGLPLA